MSQLTPIIGIAEEMLARYAQPPLMELQSFERETDDDLKVGMIVRVETNRNTVDQPIIRIDKLDNGHVRVFLGDPVSAT